MSFSGLTETTLQFLADLEENNEKPWFEANKSRYQDAFLAPAREIVVALGEQLKDIASDIHAEPKVNGSIFRIHRDVRFSKDKTPFKPHMDLMFWQGEGRGREQAAYFFRLTPDALILGAGKHGFTKDEMTRYREAVDDDEAGSTLDDALTGLATEGYRIEGEQYKRVPKGYDSEHIRAQWLKHKGLSVWTELEIEDQLFEASFTEICMQHYRAVTPIQSWLVTHVM